MKGWNKKQTLKLNTNTIFIVYKVDIKQHKKELIKVTLNTVLWSYTLRWNISRIKTIAKQIWTLLIGLVVVSDICVVTLQLSCLCSR